MQIQSFWGKKMQKKMSKRALDVNNIHNNKTLK